MKQYYDVHTLIHEIIKQLSVTKPVHEEHAWWMLEAITNKSNAQLLSEGTIELTEQQQATLKNFIDKQIHEHMPLQYLLGTVPFLGLELFVEPPVLIPRQETEEWCSRLIKQLGTLANKNITILDLCTGSGCIALALGKNLPTAQVYASDISEQALEIAKKNAKHNNITNVTFMQSDLFTHLPKNLKFDLIATNPPYIDPEVWDSLDQTITQWEDRRALVANERGLGIIKKIIAQVPTWLKKNEEMREKKISQLWIEIGYDQAEEVVTLMQQADFRGIAIEQDLSSNDRVVRASI